MQSHKYKIVSKLLFLFNSRIGELFKHYGNCCAFCSCVLQCIEDGFDGERDMGDETGQNGEKSFQDKLDHVQHNSNHASTGGGLSDIHVCW